MGTGAEYDCQTCGACCADYFGGDGYISLTKAEAENLRRRSLRLVSDSHGPLLGTVPHQGPGGSTICQAFVGNVGRECACGIYPHRPAECRRFEAGSIQCRFSRQAAGLPDLGPGPGQQPCAWLRP